MLRLYRTAALAAALVLGIVACTGETPTSPTTAPSAPQISPSLTDLPLLGNLPVVNDLSSGLQPVLDKLPLLGYVRCTPQPAAYSQARIGRDGGTIGAGKHTLRIPAGALKETVTITMRAPSDSINAVVFEPEGLTFKQGRSPTLTLDYSNCGGPSLLKKRIVYADNLLYVLEILSSLDDLTSTKVSAPIKHFSRYAVHY